MLSLNHLGLVDRAADDGAKALRETLVLFADLSDAATERKIRGVRSLEDARRSCGGCVSRRARRRRAASRSRSILEDKAFEGSGAFLLGAVLDRFFAEYVAINHFTQTVVRTVERGEMMRWPPRIGLERRPVSFRAELVAEPWRFDLLRRRCGASSARTPASRASATRDARATNSSTSRRTPISNSPTRTSKARRSSPSGGCVSTRASSACSARRARCR